MKIKFMAACSPVLLALAPGAAFADLEPYSFGVSEAISHQTNVSHAIDGQARADWLSVTDLHAAVDQELGRERLSGAASVNYSNYRKLDRDSLGYQVSGALDFSTIGDLSGSIGGSAQRHEYIYGETDAAQGSSDHNMEQNNHVYARLSLGGPSRWTIFAGTSAQERKYSSDSFSLNDVRQWSANGGTRYAVSPDLSFGVTGNYTRGEYPNSGSLVSTEGSGQIERFTIRTVSATSRWQASGASAFDANLGYTTENSGIQAPLNFVSGALSWIWTPPSRFHVEFGVSRSTSGGAGTSNLVAASSNVNDRTLNNAAHLAVSYEVTSKVSLGLNAQYTHRKYNDVRLAVRDVDGNVALGDAVSGSNRTGRYGVTAHYAVTRISELNCGVYREVRTSDRAISALTPGYSDNTVQCAASIDFR